MFHCLVIKVVCLSSLCDSLFTLSYLSDLVKHFFQKFFQTFKKLYKVVCFLHQLNWLIRRKSSICAFYFLKVLFSEQSYRFISETFSIEFSGLHYCLFVKVLSACLICDSFNRLSCLSFFVKHFFKIFLNSLTCL